jgi:cell division protein FtsN
MEKKKRFQLQMGWGGLFALFITSICILVWVFVMGFWLGQKLMRGEAELQLAQKPLTEENKIAPPALPKEPPKEMAAPPEDNVTKITPAVETVEKSQEEALNATPTAVIKEEVITAKKQDKQGDAKQETKKDQKTPVKPEEVKHDKKDDKSQKTAAVTPSKDTKEKAKEEVLKKYFSIQISSFNKKESAADEVKDWQTKGFKSQFREVDLKEKGKWYRVYIGKYKTIDEAKEAVKKIGEKKGQTAYIVSLEDK